MSGGVPAGDVAAIMSLLGDIAMRSGNRKLIEKAFALSQHIPTPTPTPPIEGRDADVERAREAAITAMGWTNPRMVEDGKRYLAGQPFASFGFGGECVLTARQVGALRRCYDGARAALQALGERG